MTDHLSIYLNTLIPKCMLAYQFIEESLRQCLYRQHAIIRLSLDGAIPYKAPIKSIEKAAMGRLIEYFKSYNDNQELITLLTKIKERRDHIAHQSFLLNADEHNDASLLQQLNEQTRADLAEAENCLEKIESEWRRLDEIGKSIRAKKKS